MLNLSFLEEMNTIMWKSIENKNYDLTSTLKSYKDKALIIFGWQDPIGICTFYQIKEAIPQATIKGIDQCGHNPSIEQPNKFYFIIKDYLKKNL